MIVPLVAWGDAWRQKAKRCIASLPADRVVVYTDKPEEFPGVRTRPIVKGMGKHRINNGCYRAAHEEFGAIVPIAADMICSAGLIEVLEGHYRSGKKLVCAPVLRTTVVPASYENRVIARSAIENQHWRQKAMSRPTTVFRKHGSGLIANCFHAHPLLYDYPIGLIDSLDGLGVRDVPDSETHVVTDSDEAIVVDVTDDDYDWEETDTKIDVQEFAKSVLPKHRWIFQHDCHIHYEDIPAT